MTVSFAHYWQSVRRAVARGAHVSRHHNVGQTRPQPVLRRVGRKASVLLGWPGAVGIGLLCLCPIFYFSVIQPAQAKLVSTRHTLIALEERKKQAVRKPDVELRSPEEQLEAFYRMFPEDRNLPASLEKIFALAQSHGIGLDQGEYKVSRNKEGSLVSFQMTLPVKGEYLQIRKYLVDLRTDIPVLSLQQVQFKRQKIGDPMVEANIRLALYLREQKS